VKSFYRKLKWKLGFIGPFPYSFMTIERFNEVMGWLPGVYEGTLEGLLDYTATSE
jgi:hypothetical protein